MRCAGGFDAVGQRRVDEGDERVRADGALLAGGGVPRGDPTVAPRLISTFQVFVASCTKPVGLS
jgi:hypothetical protein